MKTGKLTTGAAGTKQVAAGKLQGKIEIKIKAMETQGDGRKQLICEYPDGFLRTHQITDEADLKGKVVSFLWGRYAAAPVGDVIVSGIGVGKTIKAELG